MKDYGWLLALVLLLLISSCDIHDRKLRDLERRVEQLETRLK